MKLIPSNIPSALLWAFIFLFTLLTFKALSAEPARDHADTLVLTKENTLSLEAVVTDDSMANLEQDLLDMSHRLSPTAEINLVMYTPGGDVGAGSSFIDLMHAVPQKINTITLFSASMGFFIVENSTGARYITQSGTLMAHRAKGRIEGEFNGNINSRLYWILQLVTNLEQSAAKRIGVDLLSYQSTIRDEYWAVGDSAVKARVADHTIYVSCDKSLSGTHDQVIETILGNFKVTMSNCPLIAAPLKLSMPDAIVVSATALKKYVYSFYYNPADFVTNYIETGKFRQIVK